MVGAFQHHHVNAWFQIVDRKAERIAVGLERFNDRTENVDDFNFGAFVAEAVNAQAIVRRVGRQHDVHVVFRNRRNPVEVVAVRLIQGHVVVVKADVLQIVKQSRGLAGVVAALHQVADRDRYRQHAGTLGIEAHG